MAAWEEQQWKNRKAKKTPQSVYPTCPPYWLMFSNPQQSRRVHLRSAELWELGPRPRSLSLSAADSHKLRLLRAVQFLIADMHYEGGYSEDNESSSEDDAVRRKERPKSSGPQCPWISAHHTQRGSTPRPVPQPIGIQCIKPPSNQLLAHQTLNQSASSAKKQPSNQQPVDI